jgi:Protein of unknown function (DUF4232)
MRRLLPSMRNAFAGAIVTLGLLVAIGAATSSQLASAAPGRAASAAAAPGRTRCSTAGLVVWLNTQGNGTAGSSYYKLQFTNLSGKTCTLVGFAGVSAVGLSGRQLGSAAQREGASGPSVTLASGASAYATLRIVVAGNFPRSNCSQTTAAGLRVYPPGQTTAKVVPFPFEACSRSGPAYLAIASVRKS